MLPKNPLVLSIFTSALLEVLCMLQQEPDCLRQDWAELGGLCFSPEIWLHDRSVSARDGQDRSHVRRIDSKNKPKWQSGDRPIIAD